MRFKNRSMDDGEELIGSQAGAADEDSIDAMLTKKGDCIFRFDAATVLNGHLPGPGLPTNLTELIANQQERLLCLFWSLMVQGVADRHTGS